MAQPTTREEFRKYALRQLGEPVIQVNVAKTQQEDLMDDALQYFNEYAFDGLVRHHVAHQLTQDDLDNDFITLSNDILGVIKVYPLNSGNAKNPLNSPISWTIADLKHGLFGFGGFGAQGTFGFDLVNYVSTLQYAQMVNDLIAGEREWEFNFLQGQVTFFSPLKDLMNVDEFILLDTYKTVNPNTYDRVWNHMFLKQYYVALLKRAWGENLKKFGGMQLPGGVELNGKEIYEEGQEEVIRLEDDAQARWSEPPHFFSG